MPFITYESNNSGGSWWLSDENWRALEEAGWVVHWIHSSDNPSHTHDETADETFGGHRHSQYESPLVAVASDGRRWLGALAKSASKITDDPEGAVTEWERVTGESASDEGCNCCGPPHSFVYDDGLGNTRRASAVVTATALEWS